NDGDGEDEVNSTINTTPLVDVMLVLLIIFLITTPVITDTVKLKLPAEHNQIYKTKPENITLSINKDGDLYWNGSMKSLGGQDAL
ncbi:ExbD/TolR family protein, partial [Undibacterium sp. Di27W]